MGQQAWALLWTTVAVVLSTAWPRLMVLGGLPATDEGVYAYQAQWIHHSISTGHALPDNMTLAFYPMLLSWVFGIDANPLMLLRLMDLLLATAMAFVLFRVLLHVCASTVAAGLLVVLFMFTMNQPLFIQSGAKNSIAAAFVPLLLAVLLGQRGSVGQTRRWLLVGGLTALAILLRETFLPFAMLGLIALAWKFGVRPALAFVVGGLATGLILLGAVMAARGSWHGLLSAYQRAGDIYASVSDQRTELFVTNGAAAVREAAAGLVFAGALVLAMALVWLLRRERGAGVRWMFWLAAAALPLVEPATKIGFPYHFSVSLPGLAGLSAVAWRHLGAISPRVRIGVGLAGFLAIASMADKGLALWRSWPTTRAVLAAPGAQWPHEAVHQSNYLLAAEAIKRSLPATGGSLSVSGFMFTLYPLTGQLPPKADLAHLTEAIIRLNYSSDALSAALQRCPPDVVMTTTRTEWPGRVELQAAIELTGLYVRADEIPVSSTRSYGSFGGTVYRLAQPRSCTPQ